MATLKDSGERREFGSGTAISDVLISKINNALDDLRLQGISRKEVSDGYHTFGELYYHRMILFSIILNDNKKQSWKSKKHHDGTMFGDTSFVCGIETPDGQYTYHYHLDFWDRFDVEELEFAPVYDGHKPKDITRLLSIKRMGNDMTLKDSGERREFGSGAVRDISVGKGRMDLLPLDETFQFLSGYGIYDKVIKQMMAFVDGKVKDMIPAMVAFVEDTGVDPYEALLNLSIHFEDGASKYDDNNWKKGIPVNVYVDSALRHYVKYKMGMRDEPHDRAFMWNVLCGTWTIHNMPELNPYK